MGTPQSILRREAGVTCRGYDGILQSAQRTGCESRWHRESSKSFVLDRINILSRTFLRAKREFFRRLRPAELTERSRGNKVSGET